MPLTVQDVSGTDRKVIIDLANGVVSFISTKYVTRYKSHYVSKYVSNVMRVVTALTVNYMLNGSLYTQVVIPTRFIEKTQAGSGSSQGQGVSVNVNEEIGAGKWVRNREVRRVRTLPKNLPNIVMV